MSGCALSNSRCRTAVHVLLTRRFEVLDTPDVALAGIRRSLGIRREVHEIAHRPRSLRREPTLGLTRVGETEPRHVDVLAGVSVFGNQNQPTGRASYADTGADRRLSSRPKTVRICGTVLASTRGRGTSPHAGPGHSVCPCPPAQWCVAQRWAPPGSVLWDGCRSGFCRRARGLRIPPAHV